MIFRVDRAPEPYVRQVLSPGSRGRGYVDDISWPWPFSWVWRRDFTGILVLLTSLPPSCLSGARDLIPMAQVVRSTAKTSPRAARRPRGSSVVSSTREGGSPETGTST